MITNDLQNIYCENACISKTEFQSLNTDTEAAANVCDRFMQMFCWENNTGYSNIEGYAIRNKMQGKVEHEMKSNLKI